MLPEHAPFTPDQRKALESIIVSLDPTQKSWLSGYLAAGASAFQAAAVPAPAPSAKLTVVYGTESGNSETLADRAVKEAKKRGFQAVMKNMSDIQPADLSKIANLLVIVSTWGDGEPPETATAFYKEFMSADLALGSVRYSVLALGDTAYEKICQTGKDVDARLEKLGATRVNPRTDCDVDYEEGYAAWIDAALKKLAPTFTPHPVAFSAPAPVAAIEYGKKNPFPSEIIDNVLLNGEGTSKETVHVEFSLANSGLNRPRLGSGPCGSKT